MTSRGGDWLFILGPGKSARCIIVQGILGMHPDTVCLTHSDIALSAYRFACALHNCEEPSTLHVERDVAAGKNSTKTRHQFDPTQVLGPISDDVMLTAVSACNEVRRVFGDPQVFGEASQSYTMSEDAWGVVDGMFPDSRIKYTEMLLL